MQNPKISIIIPTYQRAKILPKCLDSILNQTYRNYEIIVVNDGSTDNTSEILDKYKEIFIKQNKKFKIINQENKGSNSARNRGFKQANGEYIIFWDSDIIAKQEMLEKMFFTLETHLQASYAYCSFKYGFKKFQLWEFSPQRLKKMPYIITTSLIRKRHFPGFDENIKRLQDWDLWLTMLEQGHQGIWIPEVLFEVKTGGTISRWMPSFFYKILPFFPSVKKYKQAEKVIKEKHRL